MEDAIWPAIGDSSSGFLFSPSRVTAAARSVSGRFRALLFAFASISDSFYLSLADFAG
jgi:hypothetical protein